MHNNNTEEDRNETVYSQGQLNYAMAWHLWAIAYNYEHSSSVNTVLTSSQRDAFRY